MTTSTTNVSPMSISRLISPSITTTPPTHNTTHSNNNNTYTKVPNLVPAPTKRGRGRPRKYANEEEQREARRAQILQSVRKYRQKQAETRASVSSGEGRRESGEGTSPSEHGDRGEGNVGGGGRLEGWNGDGNRNGMRQVIRGGGVKVSPKVLEGPPVEDAVLRMLDRKITDGHDVDDYGVSEEQPIDETGGVVIRIEHDHNEAQEGVQVPLAVVRQQPDRRIYARSTSDPTDLYMNNSALFLDGLLRDFMVSLHPLPATFYPSSSVLYSTSSFLHPQPLRYFLPSFTHTHPALPGHHTPTTISIPPA